MPECMTCVHLEKDGEEMPCKTCYDPVPAYEPAGEAGRVMRMKRERDEAIIKAAEKWVSAKTLGQTQDVLDELGTALAMPKE